MQFYLVIERGEGYGCKMHQPIHYANHSNISCSIICGVL